MEPKQCTHRSGLHHRQGRVSHRSTCTVAAATHRPCHRLSNCGTLGQQAILVAQASSVALHECSTRCLEGRRGGKAALGGNSTTQLEPSGEVQGLSGSVLIHGQSACKASHDGVNLATRPLWPGLHLGLCPSRCCLWRWWWGLRWHSQGGCRSVRHGAAVRCRRWLLQAVAAAASAALRRAERMVKRNP